MIPTLEALHRLTEHPTSLHVIYDPNGNQAYFCADTDGDSDHQDNDPTYCPYIDPDSRRFQRAYQNFLVATHTPTAPSSHSHWRST